MGVSNPQVGDLNGDGKDDLICGERDGYIKYFERNSDFSLKAPVNLEFKGSVYKKGSNTAPVLVDWNEDGLLDILVQYTWEGIDVLINSGTKTVHNFSSKIHVLVDGKNQTWGRAHCQVVDLNYDGKKDIVVGVGAFHDFWFYFCENTGTNSAPKFTKTPEKLKFTNGSDIPSSNDVMLEVADYNNDGGLDLIWFDYDGGSKLRVYYGEKPAVNVKQEISFKQEILTSFRIVNPFLSITCKERTGVESLSIYDLRGKLIRREKFKSTVEDYRISLDGLAAGIYLAKIDFGLSVQSINFYKN